MYLSLTKSAATLENIAGKSAYVSIGENGAAYLALFTTAANESGTGYQEVSTSGTNYARKEISGIMNTTYKSHKLEESAETAHSRYIGNKSDIVFNQAYNPSDPNAQTGADWGEIVAWGLFTSATGGTPYAWDVMTGESVNITTHKVFLFRQGCFELYLENGTVVASAVGSAT